MNHTIVRTASQAMLVLLVFGCTVFSDKNAWAQNKPPVSLEIATEQGQSPETIREWLPLLEKAGFATVRIRGGGIGDGASIEEIGSGATRSYRVTGVLASDNRLHLPAGSFTRQSAGKLSAWIEKLRAGGEEGLNARPGAFGLVPKELVAVHEALSTPVTSSTAGKTTREVVQAIGASLPMQLKVDPSVREAFKDEKVLDELQGLTAGTSLAAAIRPLGLVMVPDKSTGSLQLRIVDSQASDKVWPIGWPRKVSPRETLPDLFKFLNVEIGETPVGEAVEAIRSRLKVPMIVDQNSLARQKIDFATTKVSLPKTNTFYGSILEKLLFQARLKYEVRLDEADQPFLWITTLKQ